MSKPALTFYTAGTPNGWKPAVVLEELGLEYELVKIDISKNVQKEEWFLKINPNGRIPALVDREGEEGELKLFESAAIMWYLVEKFDKDSKLWPKGLSKQAEVMSWVMFQMGGVGPMQGQANHFVRAAPEKILYGINRYLNETDRLYNVLEMGLEGKEWLAAGQYTIADIANYCWVAIHAMCGARVDDKPNLMAWMERIKSRPAVQRGLNIPEQSERMKTILSDPQAQAASIEEVRKLIQTLSMEGQ